MAVWYVFLLMFLIRMDDNYGLFLMWLGLKPPKGSVLLTRKSLVANVFDSSLDLSSYVSV